MQKELQSLPSLVTHIVKGMQEVKGKEIVVLDLMNLNSRCTDYFVICEGDSTTQVSALADAIEAETEKGLSESALRKEGRQNAEWILLDYGNVLVHVFHKNKRQHYDVEGLWADADMIRIED